MKVAGLHWCAHGFAMQLECKCRMIFWVQKGACAIVRCPSCGAQARADRVSAQVMLRF